MYVGTALQELRGQVPADNKSAAHLCLWACSTCQTRCSTCSAPTQSVEPQTKFFTHSFCHDPRAAVQGMPGVRLRHPLNTACVLIARSTPDQRTCINIPCSPRWQPVSPHRRHHVLTAKMYCCICSFLIKLHSSRAAGYMEAI